MQLIFDKTPEEKREREKRVRINKMKFHSERKKRMESKKKSIRK